MKKQAVNTPSPTKKRPFVSTIKSQENFGEPPPLPPLQGPQSREGNESANHVNAVVMAISELPDNPSLAHVPRLLKMSLRWMHLTNTLWTAIVLDCGRQVIDKEAVANFVEVIQWRATGAITNTEFSAMYAEWMSGTPIAADGGNGNNLASTNNGRKTKPSSALPSNKKILGIFSFREILLARESTETDLDLYIGMVINEVNNVLTGTPVAYKTVPIDSGLPSAGTQVLEVCSPAWLASAEELFFTLDTPGYGVLTFDEVFFVAVCVTLGFQGWTSELELVADLSMSSLAATALQLMADAGAVLLIDSTDSASSRSPPTTLAKSWCVTLTMFKQLLIARQIDALQLLQLTSHCKGCIERVARYARESSESESSGLYQSVHPIESEDTVGSPRLWQTAVVLGAGFADLRAFAAHLSPTAAAGELQTPVVPDKQHPEHVTVAPALLFLLVDGMRYIPGKFRAASEQEDREIAQDDDVVDVENDVEADDNDSVSQNAIPEITPSKSIAKPTKNDINTKKKKRKKKRATAADLLDEAAFSLWTAFQSWGLNAYRSAILKNANVEPSRDPAYQLICAVLRKYKILQESFCDVLLDVALSYYSSEDSFISQINVSCASMLPDVENMLIKLGYGDGLEVDNNAETPNNIGVDGDKNENGNNGDTERPNARFEMLKAMATAATADSVKDIDKVVQPRHSATTGTGASPLPMVYFNDGSPTIRILEDSGALSIADRSQSKAIAATIQSQSRGNANTDPIASLNSAHQWDVVFDIEGIDQHIPTLNATERTVPVTVPLSSLLSPHSHPSQLPLSPTERDVNNVDNVGGALNNRMSRLSVNDLHPTSVNLQPSTSRFNPQQRHRPQSQREHLSDDQSVTLESERPNTLRSAASNTNTYVTSSPSSANSSPAVGPQKNKQYEMKLLDELLRTTDVVAQMNILNELRVLRSVPSVTAAAKKPSTTPSPSRLRQSRSPPHSAKKSSPATGGSSSGGRLSRSPTANSRGQYHTRATSPPVNVIVPPGIIIRHPSPPPPPPPQQLWASKRESKESHAESKPDTDDEMENGYDTQVSEMGASLSSGPSSIAELLEKGLTAGKYAHTFRQILRKMSRENSHVQLKSLEQILKLGQAIVDSEAGSNINIAGPSAINKSPQKELEQLKRRQLHQSQQVKASGGLSAGGLKVVSNGGGQMQRPPYSPDSEDGGPNPNHSASNFESSSHSFYQQGRPHQGSQQRDNHKSRLVALGANSDSEVDPTDLANGAPYTAAVAGFTVAKTSKPKVPGTMPSSTTGRKTVKKVFGHPI